MSCLCLAAVFGLVEATKPWDVRLLEKASVPELRGACDELIRTQYLHGMYVDGLGFPLDLLPDVVRDLDPDAVFVHNDSVHLEWDGEVLTSFHLVVLSDDRDPNADGTRWSLGAAWERKAPRVWTAAD